MNSPSLLLSALLAPVEFTLNTLINQDSLIKEQLRSHAGTALKIHSQEPELLMYFIIEEQDLRLAQVWEGNVSASFSGKAIHLISLLISKNKNLHDSQVDIEGDMQKAQTIQQILSAGNIDWEYHFSKFLGDIPTQAASDGLKTASKTCKENIASMQANLDEYIHEESDLLPGKNEVDSFYSRLETLSLGIDRLSARLSRLDKEKS